MNKRQKKLYSVIALIICIIFVLAMLAPVVMQAFAADNDSEIAAKQSELDKLSQQKQQLESDLKSIQNDKSQQMKYKDKLDKDISVTQSQINTLNSMITSLQKQATQTQSDIDKLEAQMKTQLANYKSRIRIMYEEGTSSYLEVLLSSQSYSAFLSRLEIVESIVERDNKIIDELKATNTKLNQAQAVIAKNLSTQESSKKDVEAKKADLASKSAEIQAIIKRLGQDESYYKQQYDIAEQEEKRVQNEINNLISPSSQSSYVGGIFAWPCPGYTTITSPFGWRFHPVLKVNKLHDGIDIGAPTGANIVAANSGKVVKAEYNTAYGNMVVIDHGGGKATLYGHMSQMLVSAGDSVTRGQVIGLVGSTGYATGPHLHFSVIVDGSVTDPMDYLS